MILRTTAVVAGGTGGGMGFLFILLSIPDASGWGTWPGRFALVGLGAASIVGIVGAFVVGQRPLVGAALFAFAGAALIIWPIYISGLLFAAAGLCAIEVLRSWRRAAQR